MNCPSVSVNGHSTSCPICFTWFASQEDLEKHKKQHKNSPAAPGRG